jgi:hypothetical protein
MRLRGVPSERGFVFLIFWGAAVGGDAAGWWGGGAGAERWRMAGK